jgi:hypothetical protein
MGELVGEAPGKRLEHVRYKVSFGCDGIIR